jgi:ribosome-associated protein
VVILDLRRLDALTDFFVICTADVAQQARAVVRNIEERVRETTGDRMLHREGMEAMSWILLDYVDVVVHVFKPSFREFYRLEDLWGDAERLAVEDARPVRLRTPRRRTVEPSSPAQTKPKPKPKPRVLKTSAAKSSPRTPTRKKVKTASTASSPTPRKRKKK